jgi:excisionase family DNA binding protein
MRTKTTANDERRALRVNEASALYGISRGTIYVLMSRGELRSVKVLGRRLIPRDAIELMIAEGAK